MNEEEDDQTQRREEVNGARRLLSAGEVHEKWKCGRDGGGHRQAGPDYQGQQTEDNEHIGEALKDIIGPNLVWARPPEPEMARDGSREPGP